MTTYNRSVLVALAFLAISIAFGYSSAASAAAPASPSPMIMPGMQPQQQTNVTEMQRIQQIVGDQIHASPETGQHWSEFNHKGAGFFVLLWGLTALIAGMTWLRQTWFRFVPPLVMLGLAEFLFLRNDPKAWPAGPIGFWISFQDLGVLEHRVFVLLIAAIAVVELLRAANKLPPLLYKFALPSLAVIASLLLLFHHHGGLATDQMMSDPHMAATPSGKKMLASMNLIKSEHVWFVVIGLGFGATKLLADIGWLRGRLGAALWPLFAIALGIYMFGYRE